MASAYSTLIPNAPYVSQLPMEAIAAGLSYRQEKYDANKAKINTFISNFSSLDLVKEEDKEHFYNNLNFLKEEIDKFGSQDLSLNGVADQIAQYISYAADDKVAAGVAGTRAWRQYQSDIETIKTKNPELYNVANDMYSSRDFNKWFSDGKAGSVMRGNTNYIPYINTFEKAQTLIKDIEPEAFVTLDPLGNFTYYKESGEKITEETIIKRLDAALLSDPSVAQQMDIDAWYQYSNISDEEFQASVSNMYDNKVKAYDQSINHHKRSLIGTSGEVRAEIEDTIKYLESQRKQYVDIDANSILQNREAIARQIYKEDFLSKMSEGFAYRTIKDKGFETNQGALSVWKEELAQARHNATIALKERELALKVQEMDNTAAADIVKAFNSGKGDPLGDAVRVGRSYGISEEMVAELVTSSPTTPTTLDTPDLKAEFAKEAMNQSYLTAFDNLNTSEEEVLQLVERPEAFGLENFNKLEQKEQIDAISKLVSLDRAAFDNHKAEGEISQNLSWANYKQQVDKYNKVLQDYAVEYSTYSKVQKELEEVNDVFYSHPKVQKVQEDVNRLEASGQGILDLNLPFDSGLNYINYKDGKYKHITRNKVDDNYIQVGKGINKRYERVFKDKQDVIDYISNSVVERVGSSKKEKIESEIYNKYFEEIYRQNTPVDMPVFDKGTAAFFQGVINSLGSEMIKPELWELVKDYSFDGVAAAEISNISEGDTKKAQFSDAKIRVYGNSFTIIAGEEKQTFPISALDGWQRERVMQTSKTINTKADKQKLGDWYLRSLDVGESSLIAPLAIKDKIKSITFKHNDTEYKLSADIEYEAVKGTKPNTTGFKSVLVFKDRDGLTMMAYYLDQEIRDLYNSQLMSQQIFNNIDPEIVGTLPISEILEEKFR